MDLSSRARSGFWTKASGLCLLFSVLAFARSEAIVIPVNCGGMLVGNIDVNVDPSGDGVTGGFTSVVGGPPATLGGAAAACGEHHFNWYQIVTADNMPPVDAGGNRLAAPYVDPPPGGYGNDPTTPGNDTQWADELPWYWDEGPDPAPGTPGFSNGLNVNDNVTMDTLMFSDFPGGALGTMLAFRTWLVSLNANGSFHSWHPGFTWTWMIDPVGMITTGAPMPLGTTPTPGEYDNLIGGFQTSVPEPAATSALWMMALAVLAGVRRGR